MTIKAYSSDFSKADVSSDVQDQVNSHNVFPFFFFLKILLTLTKCKSAYKIINFGVFSKILKAWSILGLHFSRARMVTLCKFEKSAPSSRQGLWLGEGTVGCPLAS